MLSSKYSFLCCFAHLSTYFTAILLLAWVSVEDTQARLGWRWTTLGWCYAAAEDFSAVEVPNVAECCDAARRQRSYNCTEIYQGHSPTRKETWAKVRRHLRSFVTMLNVGVLEDYHWLLIHVTTGMERVPGAGSRTILMG